MQDIDPDLVLFERSHLHRTPSSLFVLVVVAVAWCVVVRMVVKCWGRVDNFDIVYCRERQPCKRAAESHQVVGGCPVPKRRGDVCVRMWGAGPRTLNREPRSEKLKLKRVIGLL